MVNNNGVKIWVVILVTIIVAVLSSLATVKFTGNTIKVPDSTTTSDVYTKTEVDDKFTILPCNSNNCISKRGTFEQVAVSSSNVSAGYISIYAPTPTITLRSSANQPSQEDVIRFTGDYGTDYKIRAGQGYLTISNQESFASVKYPLSIGPYGVGIGVQYPTAKFDVDGGVKLRGLPVPVSVSSSALNATRLQFVCISNNGTLYRSNTTCSLVYVQE